MPRRSKSTSNFDSGSNSSGSSSGASVARNGSTSSIPKATASNSNQRVTRIRSARIQQLELDDEKKAEETHKRIIEFCKASNQCFIDDGFPHSDRSIGDQYGEDWALVNGTRPKSKLVWLRPHQVYTKEGRSYVWSVFRDPQPTDIEQGIIGNCWLLSALAVIAERPDVLEQIVLTKQYDKYGVYQIRLCLDGRWQVVIIDDFFPCRQESLSMAFAVGRRNQLWVSLIEKAFAKHLGSYARLRAGRTIEGLATLTGAPCELIDLESADDADKQTVLWVKLLSSSEAGFPMGCSCGAGSKPVNDEEYRLKGLLPRHAYSLLDVRQEGVHRLVKVRNPWGQFVWRGDWSENWSGWTPALRAKLNDESSRPMSARRGHADGCFWMPFSDFMRYFDSVEVAKIRTHLGWRELRLPVTINGNWAKANSSIRLTVEEQTEVAITLYQNGSRRVQDQVDIMVIVTECVNDRGDVGECVGRSPRRISPFLTTGDLFLRPGRYWIVALSFTKFASDAKLDAYVAVHSSKSVTAEIISVNPKIFREALVSVALKEGTVSANSTLPGIVPRYVTDQFSGMLLVIDNITEHEYVQLRCNSGESQNVLSTRAALDSVDIIPPLHRQVMMVLTHFEVSQPYVVRNLLQQRFQRGSVVPELGRQHEPPLEGTTALLHRPAPIFS